MLRHARRATARSAHLPFELLVFALTKPSLHRFFTATIPSSKPATTAHRGIRSIAGSISARPRDRPTNKEKSFNNAKDKRPSSTQTTLTRDQPKRLLEPHILSQRLKKLCEAGQLDAAIDMLKNAATGAQTTPVWNTLIWEVLKAHRWNLSYKLYTDMKRRGLSPTTRTYQTLFTGFSRVEHWPTHPTQLNHAHQLYDYFLKHLQAVKYHAPDSDELSISPLAKYIKILGDAGDFQRIFDVYYTMDSDGPLSPNRDIFTAIFQVLSVRRYADGDEGAIFHNQNGSTAKLLWMQMEKASKKSPGFAVDSHLIAMAIRALSRGRPADQELALDIVRDHLGLIRPGETPIKLANTELSVHTLAAVLESCNDMQKPKFCVHYLQQIMHPPSASTHNIRSRAHIIDRGHIEQALKAYTMLAQSAIPGQSIQAVETLEWMLRSEITRSNANLRPRVMTFNLVLSACRAQADWSGAMRTFDLMSGFKSGDFADMQVLKRKPVMDTRSRGRNLSPDAEVMSSMVRTALATHVPANIRQSLRMVDYFGVDELLSPRRISIDKSPQPKKIAKLEAFFHTKLALALEEAVDSLTRMKIGSETQINEMPRWRHLKTRARSYLGNERGNQTPRVNAANTWSDKKRVVMDQNDLPNLVPQPSQTSPEGRLVSPVEHGFQQERLPQQHVYGKAVARSSF